MTLGTIVAGYLLYAIIAALTRFTLVPDTKWEIIVLVVLVVLMSRTTERILTGGDDGRPPGLGGR